MNGKYTYKIFSAATAVGICLVLIVFTIKKSNDYASPDGQTRIKSRHSFRKVFDKDGIDSHVVVEVVLHDFGRIRSGHSHRSDISDDRLRMVREFLFEHPREFLAMVKGQIDAADRRQVINWAVDELAATSPEICIEFLIGVPSSMVDEEASAHLAKNWSNRDPALYAENLARLAPELRNRILFEAAQEGLRGLALSGDTVGSWISTSFLTGNQEVDQWMIKAIVRAGGIPEDNEDLLVFRKEVHKRNMGESGNLIIEAFGRRNPEEAQALLLDSSEVWNTGERESLYRGLAQISPKVAFELVQNDDLRIDDKVFLFRRWLDQDSIHASSWVADIPNNPEERVRYAEEIVAHLIARGQTAAADDWKRFVKEHKGGDLSE